MCSSHIGHNYDPHIGGGSDLLTQLVESNFTGALARVLQVRLPPAT